MDPALFESYPGYAATSDVLRTDEDGRTTIRTPQVAHKARAHLGCDGLAGAELEDDGVEGTAGSHWEQRIFEVRRRPRTPLSHGVGPMRTAVRRTCTDRPCLMHACSIPCLMHTCGLRLPRVRRRVGPISGALRPSACLRWSY